MSKAFNPLSQILNDNKLNGSNYVDWKRNLDIVLTAEEYSFALTENEPEVPSENPSQEIKDKHRLWVKANNMARCYILGSMTNVLQHQHNHMLSARDIMLNL